MLFVDFLYSRGVFSGFAEARRARPYELAAAAASDPHADEENTFVKSKKELLDVPTRTIVELLQLGTYVNSPSLCRFQEIWLETRCAVDNCVELLVVADDVGCAPCLQA